MTDAGGIFSNNERNQLKKPSEMEEVVAGLMGGGQRDSLIGSSSDNGVRERFGDNLIGHSGSTVEGVRAEGNLISGSGGAGLGIDSTSKGVDDGVGWSQISRLTTQTT